MQMEDEEDVLISQVAKMGRKVQFAYEYDFGIPGSMKSSWRRPEAEPKVKNPRCIEGARGTHRRTWVASGAMPTSCKRSAAQARNHRDMKKWIGGKFDRRSSRRRR
jgi:hypothetical protein